MRYRQPSKLWHLFLVVAGLTMLAPLAFMFSTALSTPAGAMRATENIFEMLVPREWEWKNFAEVWEVVPFLRYYFNSLAIAVIVTVGQVFTSACAAYAFSRLQWPCRDKLFLCYLATTMVPGSVTMLPNFIAMKMAPELLTGIFPGID